MPGYQANMVYVPSRDATVVAVVNLYGWSLRGMPASKLSQAALDAIGAK